MKDIFSMQKNNNIMAKQLLLIMVLLALFSCKETSNEFDMASNEFEILIKTESKSDSLSMYPSFVSENLLDSTHSILFKGAIKDGEVNFKGNKPDHPVMFDIMDLKIGRLSDKFFIDNGATELSVSFVNKDTKVFISEETKSKTQKEYEVLKREGLDQIEDFRRQAGSAEEKLKFDAMRDTLIVDFLKKNPNSYVPLWLLVNHFSRGSQEYNKLYDDSIGLFSDEIKKTELFKKFKASIEKGKNFSFKDKELLLQNMDLEAVQFTLSSLNDSKYILLDFWYSNCGPCLFEMPKYIPLYEKYKAQGFEIVSISSDKTSKIENWKTVIQEKGFSWTHYLDENRVETTKLNIRRFPTTFLLNGDGTIIERDIKPEKLKEFLSANLD